MAFGHQPAGCETAWRGQEKISPLYPLPYLTSPGSKMAELTDAVHVVQVSGAESKVESGSGGPKGRFQHPLSPLVAQTFLFYMLTPAEK